jgi:hypothetical protein
MNNKEMRQVLLDTLQGVKEGKIDPRAGASIARLAGVALKSAIAEAQYSVSSVDFFGGINVTKQPQPATK